LSLGLIGTQPGGAPAARLASPLACDPAHSRGRRHPEAAAPTRDAFQRDRDRIVHSSAFRRLVYKTQVFLNHEGDLFRTRLTHSLEVAQLARSMARALGLNEDLTEAIALAHDLGHTPFGHAGQDALNACMQPFGGFEHNLQSLRVVDALERRYANFDGLNLSFEAREGILKHCSRRNAELLESVEPQGVAARFLQGTQPGLEAQLCNLADEIAYASHDVDDGVRSGLLSLEQMMQVPLFAGHHAQALAEHPALAGPGQQRRLLYETLRRMLSSKVYDVTGTTRAAMEAARAQGLRSPDAVRTLPSGQALVRFSDRMRADTRELKAFLMANLYRHPQVVQTMDAAKAVVEGLFSHYLDDPSQMPTEHAQSAAMVPAAERPRVVADYIAGMTDRMASREHARLTGQALLP
jgi:dGTPase